MVDLLDVGVPSLFTRPYLHPNPKFRACHFQFARSSYCSYWQFIFSKRRLVVGCLLLAACLTKQTHQGCLACCVACSHFHKQVHSNIINFIIIIQKQISLVYNIVNYKRKGIIR